MPRDADIPREDTHGKNTIEAVADTVTEAVRVGTEVSLIFFRRSAILAGSAVLYIASYRQPLTVAMRISRLLPLDLLMAAAHSTRRVSDQAGSC